MIVQWRHLLVKVLLIYNTPTYFYNSNLSYLNNKSRAVLIFTNKICKQQKCSHVTFKNKSYTVILELFFTYFFHKNSIPFTFVILELFFTFVLFFQKIALIRQRSSYTCQAQITSLKWGKVRSLS